MTTTGRRGAIRGAAALVRRYLPTALAVAGVVALLDLTPTLRSPAVRTQTSVPTTIVVGTTGARPGH